MTLSLEIKNLEKEIKSVKEEKEELYKQKMELTTSNDFLEVKVNQMRSYTEKLEEELNIKSLEIESQNRVKDSKILSLEKENSVLKD